MQVQRLSTRRHKQPSFLQSSSEIVRSEHEEGVGVDVGVGVGVGEHPPLPLLVVQ